jgi:protein pelota
MKLIKRQISAKDGSGMVLLRPEDSEDLWRAYNLVREGDRVRSTTVRKIVKESSTGSTSSAKKRLMLTIAVERVDFDADALQVRVSGQVSSENDSVKLGAYHTLTLEPNQNFSVEKDCWDQVYLDVLEEATNPERQAEVAAAVMQPGLAHVCLVAGALTVTRARVEVNIPKKRTGSSGHEKATKRFYEAVYQAILRHVDFGRVKCLLVGSPGFVAQDFLQYARSEAVRRDDRAFIENRSKIVVCRTSSGHKHALEEAFADPAVVAQMVRGGHLSYSVLLPFGLCLLLVRISPCFSCSSSRTPSSPRRWRRWGASSSSCRTTPTGPGTGTRAWRWPTTSSRSRRCW